MALAAREDFPRNFLSEPYTAPEVFADRASVGAVFLLTPDF